MSERKPNFIYPIADKLAVLSFHPLVQILREKSSQKTGILLKSSDSREVQETIVKAPTSGGGSFVQNPPESQPIDQPVQQGRDYLFSGDKVRDFGARLRGHPFLQGREEKSPHQELTPQPKTQRMFEPPVQQTQSITTGSHRFCLSCGKKYLIDTKFRRCVDCGGKISLTDAEERVMNRSIEKAQRFGGNTALDADGGCPVCHQWPCKCIKERRGDMSLG